VAVKKREQSSKTKLIAGAIIAGVIILAFRIIAFPSTTVFPGVTFYWNISESSQSKPEEGDFGGVCSYKCEGEIKEIHRKEVPIVSKVETFNLCLGKITNNCQNNDLKAEQK
jgi:hypothetical protein